VPEINQSLLSVGQMMEKKYSLNFKDLKSTIFYSSGSKSMIVEMRSKNFPVEWKQASFRVFEAKFSAQKKGGEKDYSEGC